MPSVMPAVGRKAPAFQAESTGGPVSLATHAGEIVVLYFYPKDNTPGCTTEGQDFAARHASFVKLGATIYGVSRDSLKSHANFKAKMDFPFELITDSDETLCTAYDVMKMKNMYGKQVRGVERSTFVIGKDSKLVREWRGLKVPGHAQEVLDFVGTL